MTQNSPRSVLVIEDDRTLNRLLCEQIADLGHIATSADSRVEALDQLRMIAPDLALLDIRLPDCDGLGFLPELREYCPVIVLTAFGSIDQAVGAVKAGASEYLLKPVSLESLEIAMGKVFETSALQRDLAFWRAEAQRSNRAELIGDSPAMTELRHMVHLLASTDAPVLILGEGGTGKGVTAAAIHAQSPRANGRFVSVECNGDMPDSEIFGKERDGRLIEGLMAAAESGTIFLNDIDKLPGTVLGRLHNFLQHGSYRPHGSTAEIQANVRVIAASTTDLESATRQGGFSSQLYYQLSGFTLHVPPLRQRLDDIEALANMLLAGRNFQRGVEKALASDALEALRGYDWPGNVRELANALDRGVIMSAGQSEINAAHLGLSHRPPGEADGDAAGSALTLRFQDYPALEQLRDNYIAILMDRFDGNRQRIAATLGISERNLYRIIKTMAGGGKSDA